MRKIIVFLMLACLVLPVFAAQPRLIDNADLLSTAQEHKLSNRLEEVGRRLDIDIVVLTEPDIGWKDPMDYADDYYDRKGYRKNGVLLLLSMENRDWWLSTSGSCIDPVDADTVEDFVIPYIKDGDYYEGFMVFADLVELSVQHSGDAGDIVADAYGVLTFEPYVTQWYDGLAICLTIGLVAGGITVAVMAFGMKSVRQKGSAGDYVNEGSLQLSVRQDLYLYQRVSKRARPKNNGTHTSSSGRSHGGGGGKF